MRLAETDKLGRQGWAIIPSGEYQEEGERGKCKQRDRALGSSLKQLLFVQTLLLGAV